MHYCMKKGSQRLPVFIVIHDFSIHIEQIIYHIQFITSDIYKLYGREGILIT